MNKESKISKIGMIISVAGILAIIAVAMINYFSFDGFIKQVGATIYYNLISVEDTNLSLTKRIDQTKNRIAELSDDITLKDQYINLNTQIDLVLGDRLFVDSSNTVGLLDNGYLSFVYNQIDKTDEITNYILDLQSKTKIFSPETEFLYVQAPFKISKFDRQLPEYINSNTNYLIDKLLQNIDGKIDYIDLRQSMYDQGLNQYDYFYKTDHHWLPQGGLWSVNEVSKILESDYGFNINYDYLNLENFQIDVYENVFLGSEGKRVGEGLVGKDDISLIYPKFETNFTFEIAEKQTVKNGTFEETIFEYSWLNDDNQGCVYFGGLTPTISIKNNLIADDKKILVVRDSFADVFAPYLILNCQQVDLLDLRLFEAKKVEEYIANMEPDIVMFLYTGDPLVGYDR